jgi:hypothetical protein
VKFEAFQLNASSWVMLSRAVRGFDIEGYPSLLQRPYLSLCRYPYMTEDKVKVSQEAEFD